MRYFVMFVTAVCVLFLLQLKWPKNKSFYNQGSSEVKSLYLHETQKKFVQLHIYMHENFAVLKEKMRSEARWDDAREKENRAVISAISPIC